jgi:hypothetical protein
VPTTSSGINYSISCKGSGANPTERKERWIPGASQVYEIARVKWGDWDQFNEDVLGVMAWQPDGGGGYKLNRSLPMVHPVYDWMIATNTELLEIPAAVGPNGRELLSFGDFDSATEVVAGVTFESVLFALADNATAWAGSELVRYVERPFKFAVENLTLKGQILEFVDNGQPIGTDPAITFPNSELLYTWKRVPAMPNGTFPAKLYANIGATMGSINSDTFDGIPAYSLLCNAPDIQQEIGPNGQLEYTIKYPLIQRPAMSPAAQPWNSKFRVVNAGGGVAPGFYDVQIHGSGGRRPYQAVPFANLFKNA